jgi:hypothetical protein
LSYDRWKEPLPTDPTPEEIAEATAEIRSRWSPGERRRRGAWMENVAWEAPEASVDGEDLAWQLQ